MDVAIGPKRATGSPPVSGPRVTGVLPHWAAWNETAFGYSSSSCCSCHGCSRYNHCAVKMEEWRQCSLYKRGNW
jgi:hypothetical protein